LSVIAPSIAWLPGLLSGATKQQASPCLTPFWGGSDLSLTGVQPGTFSNRVGCAAHSVDNVGNAGLQFFGLRSQIAVNRRFAPRASLRFCLAFNWLVHAIHDSCFRCPSVRDYASTFQNGRLTRPALNCGLRSSREDVSSSPAQPHSFRTDRPSRWLGRGNSLPEVFYQLGCGFG
jgi:hypothetical protein